MPPLLLKNIRISHFYKVWPDAPASTILSHEVTGRQFIKEVSV